MILCAQTPQCDKVVEETSLKGGEVWCSVCRLSHMYSKRSTVPFYKKREIFLHLLASRFNEGRGEASVGEDQSLVSEFIPTSSPFGIVR
jgi:hypothetical protein